MIGKIPRPKLALRVGIWLLSFSVWVSAADHQNLARILSYQIAPQALDQALVAFSLQSGLQIIADGQLTSGLMSPGVTDQLSPLKALEQLLKGSGLTFRLNGESSVILEKQPDTNNATDATMLPAVTVTGRAILASDDPDNPDYFQPNAVTASKTDTPIMETPFSVKRVTQQVMQDQQVVRMEKALQNVAGVLQEASSSLLRDSFTIRGFSTGNAILAYRDNAPFPQAYSGFSSKRDPANLERIEVLKGPGSILFGRAEPGGIINMLTKQPLAKPYYALQQQFGSFDYSRTSMDATGPLTQDGDLLYRFNAAYESADSFADFVNSDRIFLAPVLKWQPVPSSQFTAEFEYQDFDESPGAAIPYLGNRPAHVPRNRNISDPDFPLNKGNRILAGLNWSHDFNDHWQLSHRFNYNSIRSDFKTHVLRGGSDRLGNITRGMVSQAIQSDNYFTSLNLTGKFKALGFSNTLLFGGDYYRADDIDPFDVRIIPGRFNIFNPVYSSVGFDDIDQSHRVAFGVDATTSWYGLYLQDQIELPYQWFATGGFRYDQAYQYDYLTNTVSGDEHRLSPRGGLLWRPLPELSLYTSYSENFGAGNGSNGAQQLLPAQTAQQTEIGVKTELLNGRFSATVAYFDLIKQNIVTSDPNNPLLLLAIGEAESKGIELDIAGELLPGWQIIGGYSDLFLANITHDVDAHGGAGTQGKRLPNAPQHSGSLFTSYELQAGLFKGFKFGGGVNAVGQRQGNQDNSYQVPGYALVNLMTSYSIKAGTTKITAQLNVENLLDKYYLVGSNTGEYIFFGAPRSFLGSIRLEY